MTWEKAWRRASATAALALTGAAAGAQVVPSVGDGRDPRPALATPAEPDAPALTRLDDAALAGLFRVDPSYPRGDRAHVKVVGAYAVAEPAGVHLLAAWGLGFLPVTLSFSDGRCFAFTAAYEGGILSNGRISREDCAARRPAEEAPPPPAPPGRSLRLIGSAWSFGAWADDRTGTTIVTAPSAKAFEPLFTARMRADAILAMVSPDSPGGNVTLVGRIDGKLTVVTLEVSY